MPKIFISYRRDDSQLITERIHDSLVRAFGAKNVFLDVDDNIPPGSKWEDVLRTKLSESDILLVVIGQQWLDMLKAREGDDDYVRFEVETGLTRHDDLKIIPILVNGVESTTLYDLPESMQKLHHYQAMQVRPNPDFHTDMNRLIRHLKPRQTFALLTLAFLISFVVIASIVFMSINTVVPSPSETPTSTETDSPSPTETLTLTSTDTPLPTDTLTLTPSNTPTLTDTPTETFTPTLTDTSIPTDTLTPTPTLTDIPTRTDTPLPTETLTPTNTPIVIVPGSSSILASWLWQDGVINNATTVLSQLSNHDFNLLYLHAYQTVNANPELLSSFIADANQVGIMVELLGGDPLWALADEHETVLIYVDNIVTYTQNYPEQAPVAVHLNIEPHLLSSWNSTDLNAESNHEIARQYLDLLQSAKTRLLSTDLALNVDVAFWYDEINFEYDSVRKTLVEHIMDVADSVTILAYRDEVEGVDGILAHTAQELEFAEASDTNLLIGLETNRIEPDKVTFCEEGEDALVEAMAEIEGQLSDNPYYAGIAVHDYLGFFALDDCDSILTVMPPANTVTPVTPEAVLRVSALSGNINIRQQPHNDGSVIGSLSSDDSAPVIGQTTCQGFQWWQIELESRSGWVRADVVEEDGVNINIPEINIDCVTLSGGDTPTPPNACEIDNYQCVVMHSAVMNGQPIANRGILAVCDGDTITISAVTFSLSSQNAQIIDRIQSGLSYAYAEAIPIINGVPDYTKSHVTARGDAIAQLSAGNDQTVSISQGGTWVYDSSSWNRIHVFLNHHVTGTQETPIGIAVINLAGC